MMEDDIPGVVSSEVTWREGRHRVPEQKIILSNSHRNVICFVVFCSNRFACFRVGLDETCQWCKWCCLLTVAFVSSDRPRDSDLGGALARNDYTRFPCQDSTREEITRGRSVCRVAQDLAAACLAGVAREQSSEEHCRPFCVLDGGTEVNGLTLYKQLVADHKHNSSCSKDQRIALGCNYYDSLRAVYAPTNSVYKMVKPTNPSGAVTPALRDAMLLLKGKRDREPLAAFCRRATAVTENDMVGLCRAFEDLNLHGNSNQVNVALDMMNCFVRLDLTKKYPEWTRLLSQRFSIALQQVRVSVCAKNINPGSQFTGGRDSSRNNLHVRHTKFFNKITIKRKKLRVEVCAGTDLSARGHKQHDCLKAWCKERKAHCRPSTFLEMHERIWPLVLPVKSTKRLLGVEDETGFEEIYADLVEVTRASVLGEGLFGGIFQREARKTVNTKILARAESLINGEEAISEDTIGKAETELLDELMPLFEDSGKGKTVFQAKYRGFNISLEAGSLQQRVHLTLMSAIKGKAAEVNALPAFGPEGQLFEQGAETRKAEFSLSVLKRTTVARNWAQGVIVSKKFSSASEMQVAINGSIVWPIPKPNASTTLQYLPPTKERRNKFETKRMHGD
eukprot:6486304-Amphidinium_carterae.2